MIKLNYFIELTLVIAMLSITLPDAAQSCHHYSLCGKNETQHN